MESVGWSREEMAARVAEEISFGKVVNLGIGMPTLVANYLSPEEGSMLHSENGLLGMGPFPFEGEEHPQLINAGKQTVTIVPGGSTFDSTLSFAMIRGGHVDIAILGAMEVSEAGDLANWSIPNKLVTGMGGAMDLVSGAKRVIVMTQFRAKTGALKLVRKCSLPLTGEHCVDQIVSDLGVFAPLGVGKGFKILELAEGVSRHELGDPSLFVS